MGQPFVNLPQQINEKKDLTNLNVDPRAENILYIYIFIISKYYLSSIFHQNLEALAAIFADS